MREIKFRAWDRLNKKIVTSGLSINIDTTDRVIPVSFTQGDIAYCRDNDVNSGPNIHSDIELMQYTGLKDKNGVEIYEGDIIRLNDLEILCTVEFDKGCFVAANHQGGFVAYRELWEQTLPEVIGNIYENPDLIDI